MLNESKNTMWTKGKNEQLENILNENEKKDQLMREVMGGWVWNKKTEKTAIRSEMWWKECSNSQYWRSETCRDSNSSYWNRKQKLFVNPEPAPAPSGKSKE